MSKHQTNPTIEWKEINGHKCLYFQFGQNFCQQDATDAVQKWQHLFDTAPQEKHIIIWDCLDMKNYDLSSRAIWQRSLKAMKSQIESIWLISHSLAIRRGARLMSLFTSYDIHSVGSENEIEF